MIENFKGKPVTDYLISTVLSTKVKAKINPLLGESYYINLNDYIFGISFLYESGAILGRAILEKNRVTPFLQMLDDDFSIEHWQEMARQRYSHYVDRYKREPRTFCEFIYESQIEIRTGIHPSDFAGISHKNTMKILDLLDKPISLIHEGNSPTIPQNKKLKKEIQHYVYEGIGFGIAFSDRTKIMNDSFWNSFKDEKERLSKEDFLNPEMDELPLLSYFRQEHAVVVMVADWAKKIFPLWLKILDISILLEPNPHELFLEYQKWFEIVYLYNQNRLISSLVSVRPATDS